MDAGPDTSLLLVRHGHTAGNDGGMDAPMAGWADLPLSARGVAEAQKLAERLAREAEGAPLYASPLERAQRTAALIGEAIHSVVLLDDALREIGCGEADGLPLAQVRSRFPEAWAGNLRHDDPGFRWPGGESYEELRARSVDAATRIASGHPGGRVVVVTHAGVISQLVGWIRGVSPARWDLFRPRNGSITELVLRGGTRGRLPAAGLVRFDA